MILAIDQGTTSTRAVLYDEKAQPVASAQCALPQVYPQPGWVEHDAERIFADTLAVCRQALAEANTSAGRVAAIGITNQRETTVLWERATGRPVHHAIVWQDRRTASRCDELRSQGHEPRIQAATGLVLDPYFSASKLEWLLAHVDGARQRAERGELAFGTIDSWLLFKLTGGKVHATDATNASRTMLFDIVRQRWDDDLLALFGVPSAVLPVVRDSAADFGRADPELLGAAIPIAGIAGDQQAAVIGQACIVEGMIKCTYGTGAFALLHTGNRVLPSRNRLLATVAYRLRDATSYALEGSIFAAGSIVQWLRDALGIIRKSSDVTALAAKARADASVFLVPAFTGLGAPYWDAAARGAILGLTRDAGAPEIARAALEAVAFQTRDLIEAMGRDGAPAPRALRVDGGMAVNDVAMQMVADLTGVPVERPRVIETTVLGAAYLAGLQSGLFASLADVARTWQVERAFSPAMPAAERDARYAGWLDAVRRVRSAGAV